LQGGYVAEDLYQRLATEGRIAESLTKKELESIRHHLHALLNNDLAMNAAFRPFSTFGNDYTGTSELFLSQHTGLMGMQARYLSDPGGDSRRQRGHQSLRGTQLSSRTIH
jgi:hypothetical protein